MNVSLWYNSSMNLIDGKALAAKMQAELKVKVDKLKEADNVPGLAVILVGEDPASQIYVRNKARQATAIGLNSSVVRLPETVSEQELLDLIEQYNQSEQWHGILVQLPLPEHISEEKVLLAIDPEKDVDGFHPVNVGKMVIGEDTFLPCTPAGIIEMIKRTDIDIEGKECVVIGRSNIVGKPMAMLMLRENATVTVAHSRTKNLKELCKQADILIVAIGKPKFITEEYVKEGAVVIDVGIHRLEGKKLCGDVDFDVVEPLASAITPVPGGVGPMTIAMLMNNCVETMR